MKKVKLAIVYQVIFHYRIPFYKEIEKDPEIDYILLHGSGIKNTKVQNAANNLKNTSQLFTLRFPYKQNNQRKYFSFFPYLFFKLIIEKPDVIMIEGVTSIINTISTYCYAKLFRKKIIFWSLGKVPSKRSSVSRQKMDKLVHYLEKKADAIFTYSSIGVSYFLERKIPKEKIFLGVNVLDTREILQRVDNIFNKKDFRILFVGSIIPEKKLEILLDAFLKLDKEVKGVYLDIVGSGNDYYEELKQNYDKMSKNIQFHGRIISGLEQYYEKASVFVLPGLGGLAISEAMSYGLPVISSSADGTEIDLINDSCGFYFSDLDTEILHDLLEKLYNNTDELEKMGINARERMKDLFSFDKYYESFKRCLNYVNTY